MGTDVGWEADKTDTIGESESLQVYKKGGKSPPPHPSSYIAISSVLSSRPNRIFFLLPLQGGKNRCGPVFFCLFSSLMVNIHVFQDISICVIFFSVIVLFKQSISKLKSLKNHYGEETFSLLSLSLLMVYII